ncbi:MAG TPA: TIGR02646 family protein [Desulfobulbaceae bacterium]|nr:TIGR02646 family protein [Desulfobulbaceae bacterium]
MKRVEKGQEPEALLAFRQQQPDATWDEMRNEDRGAAEACWRQAIADQHGLCAYCERKIDGWPAHKRRVEHFHPKSDSSPDKNWHLDWQNMLACCDGGEKEGSEQHPLPENLSCDAHKNHLSNEKKLPPQVESELYNPLHLPAFPNFFAFDKRTGELRADAAACAQTSLDAAKLTRSIEVSNLNCQRLKDRRRKEIVFNIERNKKTLRQKGYLPEQVPAALVKRYFNGKWPEFFTTIRCCLGKAAEDYLRAVNYQG